MLRPVFDDVLDGNVIQGKALAARVRSACREQVDQLRTKGRELKLVVVRAGDDPASEIYVKHKIRACKDVGIQSEVYHLPASISEAELLRKVQRFNDDPDVDGILVQLPLPGHIHSNRVIEAVDPRKDVDGFHPTNLGLLMARWGVLEPCTPAGCMVILDAIGAPIAEKNAVIVGRSQIVGRPIAQMLLRRHATVTICHRHTSNLADHVRRADILVVATGVPNLIRGEWVKEGSVVIDVGITRLENKRLCGDVEFEVAKERAAAITPVPGGVGPMTVAMLLWNTVKAGMFRGDHLLSGDAYPLNPF